MPEIGMIVRDNEGRVQCHCCGKFMGLLAPHAKWKHGYSDFDEYKRDFGINRGQGLCSPSVSLAAKNTLEKKGLVNRHNDYNLQRFNCHKPHRLQGRIHMSVGNTGIKRTLTAKKMMAQKANFLKAQEKNILYRCSSCGCDYYGRKSSSWGAHHYCADCYRMGRPTVNKEQRKIYNKRAYAKRKLEKMRREFKR